MPAQTIAPFPLNSKDHQLAITTRGERFRLVGQEPREDGLPPLVHRPRLRGTRLGLRRPGMAKQDSSSRLSSLDRVSEVQIDLGSSSRLMIDVLLQRPVQRTRQNETPALYPSSAPPWPMLGAALDLGDVWTGSAPKIASFAWSQTRVCKAADPNGWIGIQVLDGNWGETSSTFSKSHQQRTIGATDGRRVHH